MGRTETHDAHGQAHRQSPARGRADRPQSNQGLAPGAPRRVRSLSSPKRGVLKVHMSREALADGRKDETVHIRNPLTKNYSRAIVTTSGVVRGHDKNLPAGG